MFMDGRTDGQTTDGRQAHPYIPRTFRSGDKNERSFSHFSNQKYWQLSDINVWNFKLR